MFTPKFGQRIMVNTQHVLVRRYLGFSSKVFNRPGNYWYGDYGVEGWNKLSRAKGKLVPVLFVGWRTLSDGFTIPGGREDSSEYNPIVHYKVAMVIFNERGNPKPMFLSDINAVYESGYGKEPFVPEADIIIEEALGFLGQMLDYDDADCIDSSVVQDLYDRCSIYLGKGGVFNERS